MNKNIQLIGIIMLLSLIILPTSSVARPNAVEEPVLVDELIHRAQQLKLAGKPAWLNLLHYKSTLLGGRESQVDDSAFFMAKNGAIDASAELEATLRGFFSMKSTAHPRCLFPARLHWLNSQLDFADLLSDISCPQFDQWKEKLNAQSVTLLFPSMHLDNPASMFGHTFIRFDRPDKNNLLSYTLSYAASYDESDHVLVYSWKGITGGYSGRFYLQAFFETLQIYSDIEQRDIWEYELNLNQQEIDQLLRHIWEVKSARLDYFFFRENCSFRLLALLDVARVGANMSMDSHPFYAVPVDTVRDIGNAGLVAQSNYRPATHNQVLQIYDQISIDERKTAIALTQNEIQINAVAKSFTEEQQVKIYQLADAILSLDKELTQNQQTLQFGILSALSHLSVSKYEFEFETIPPEQSHQSARWQLSAGQYDIGGQGDEYFYEIGFRPVFHDLLDMGQGFIEGASINVLETQLRWYQREEELKLEKLDLFSLQSIVAVSPWATPLSQKISFQIKQRDIAVDNQVLEFEFQFATGYSAKFNSVIMYALAQTQFDYATELENNHAFYLGVDTGLLWSFNNSIMSGQTEFEYQLLGDVSGEEGNLQKVMAGIQFNILKNQALRLTYEHHEYELFETEEAKLNYFVYF